MGCSQSVDTKALDAEINSADVVLFVRPGCPFCAKAEADLKKHGIDYKSVILTDYLEALVQKTGKTSAPSTWIKGTYVGGCDDGTEPWHGVVPMLKSGRFQEMLAKDASGPKSAGEAAITPEGGANRDPDSYELPTATGTNQIGKNIGDVNMHDAEFKQKLTRAQYFVLRHKHTEPRGAGVKPNGFDDVFDDGVYLCGSCHAAGLEVPVYSSTMKYACGCGWPGFWTNVKDAIYEKTDADGRRVEVLCARCDGHMGHVFRGEGHGYVTDERHCVNSMSIVFAPASGGPVEIPKYNGKTIPSH